MMRKAFEKILNTLEKCCEETHQNGKSESKSDDEIKKTLPKDLSINEQYIFAPSHKKTKGIIEKIKEKEDFRQRDELFSDDEKWYLVYGKKDKKIDISLLYDKIKSIPCNVIFNNCNIDLRAIKLKDLKKDNAETIKNHLYFYNCTFENLLIKLKNIIFEKTLTFNQCAFYNDLDIHQNQFLDHLVFINCSNEQNDKKIISLDLKENEFEGYLFIKNCTIEKINLWKNKFKNRCYFVDSNFGYKDEDNTTKLNFSNTHFEDEVYFNNSEFYNYADFHECKFDNIACFYGVKFYKAPNFSACYFKEQKAANLINVDIDELNFESVEKYIEDNYQDETYENKQEITEEQRSNNCKLKCAKHLKDSFRVIKDILITQNNTLEAQEWHKLELYAKEKENHINLNVKEREKNTDIFKNILIWFNCVLLNVYRNTSDHHNDFLKILNFTVGMIALYGVFFYLLLEVYMHLDIIFIESFFRFKIIDYIYLCLFVCLTIIMFLYKNKKSIFAKSILFLTIYITFYIVYIKILNFVNITYFREWFFYLLCYIIGIYIFYLAFIFISKFKFINFILKLCIYLAFLSIWILSSNFINPFTGVFSSDKLYESKFEKSLNDLNASAIINLASILQNDSNLHLKDQNISFTELNSAKALIVANKENLLKLNDVNSNIAKEVLGEEYTHTINQDKIIENTIKSTSVLYSIILLLCIFSLQKTARKNSIVPS
ncbi:pentapeptide repeat-containing protein [Campylobacter coli]|uniref:pentapeptide repeat-containing protein n=2 Tax=Campylobacter coli TaxID=195 RepID=UPI00092EA6BB|nr:pentapeptide repeat-containing protein [Campylobacter coli]